MDLSSLSPMEALGLTIIGEARGEPIQGQVGVGCVCRNRLHNHSQKYKSYNDVVFEPKQFSCWNTGDANYGFLIDLATKMIHAMSITDIYLRQCLFVARGIVDWSVVDNTHGAENYIEKKLFYSEKRPSWSKNAKQIVELGNQVFFNL